MLAEWRHVPAYEESARAVLGASGFEILAAQFAAAQASMARSASLLFTGWLQQAGRRRGGDQMAGLPV
jgi:predicted  nucleic acid-binding Zn ribbon protein